MFEHGIEQDVAVEDLTVLVSESHGHGKKKMKKSMMEAEEMAAVTPEGGEANAGKASKKDLKMPLEKLKAIMEKKKSEAYKAMLRSQGKMEEEVEQVDEKMLTSAEMKKREEVAKAMERENPGMPMGKKMAIATATAKKVAEELVGNQHKIDANKNNKIDAHDFKLLSAKKKTMKEFVEKLAESLIHEEEYDAFKHYPKSNHLHMWTHENEERHVIKGVEHTEENAAKVMHKVHKAGAKLAKLSLDDHEEAMSNATGHHELADNLKHVKPTKVHNSIDDYVKHHAAGDAKYSKQMHSGDE
jgi:hypothetical protein